MARIFQLRIELFEPSETRPHMCVETHEQVRRAHEHRVLHFGYPKGINLSDVDYLLDVIGTEVRSLMGRTVGIADVLEF